MKPSRVARVLLFVILAAIALPALAASKGDTPLYTIYWPWESCSEQNVTCVAIERIDLKTGQGSLASQVLTDGYTPDPTRWVWTPYGVTFDVDGTMYTLNNWFDLVAPPGYSRLGRMDLATGQLTYIGEAFSINTAGPDMDACGNLFVTGFTVGDPADPADTPMVFGDSFLYRVDTSTGATTRIGDTSRTDWMDLAFDSKGTLWATTDNKLYRLDPKTGASTFVTNITGVPNKDIPGACEADLPYMEVMTIAFDENDVLWATAMRGFSTCYGLTSPVMKIDVKTGKATLVGYTNQIYNHGGDIDLRKVKVCHRADNGKIVPLLINYDSLPDHLAHDDVRPGYPCECP